jgi:hypothetical protein
MSKPHLPEIALSQNFVRANQSQTNEYASSTSVVTQLVDALDAWLSHCRQVLDNLEQFHKNCEQDCVRSVNVADNLICDIAAALRRLELETSFYIHFDTDQVKAVRKVLTSPKLVSLATTTTRSGESCLNNTIDIDVILHGVGTTTASTLTSSVQAKLEELDEFVKILEAENKKLARSRELFTILDSYCAKDSSWNLLNCDDTLPPLFCALRAVFICCPLFGKTNPQKFSSLIRCVLKRIETLILETLPSLFKVQSVSSSRSGVEDAVSGCLAAQGACITVQEEFYKLRISVSEACTKEFTAVLYQGIDEDTIFINLDFYYDRCVILLQLLTVIKQRREELFLTTGGAAEKLLSEADLLFSKSVAHEDLIDAIRMISLAPSTKPKDIINRIQSRASEHAEKQALREKELMLQAAEEAATGRKQSYLQQQQILHRKQKELREQEDREQEAAIFNPNANSSSPATNRGSRVADSNEKANREWSLQYGDQREQLAILSERDPYYSVVIAFNPPRVLILGIPLKQKQLEMISTRFQDALRSRVLHSADKIRHNKMNNSTISTTNAILKAPYVKFRSATQELADARYEAHERTFHKKSGLQMANAAIMSQMMLNQNNSSVHNSRGGVADSPTSGSSLYYNNSSSQVNNNNNSTNNTNQSSTLLEIELLQLRRYHVAAAHNAFMLDLPVDSSGSGVGGGLGGGGSSSSAVASCSFIDSDELQSYAVQQVLDCFEQIDGNDCELATTNAYTDVDGVYWSFFVFRYFPAMPKSRRERRNE